MKKHTYIHKHMVLYKHNQLVTLIIYFLISASL